MKTILNNAGSNYSEPVNSTIKTMVELTTMTITTDVQKWAKNSQNTLVPIKETYDTLPKGYYQPVFGLFGISLGRKLIKANNFNLIDISNNNVQKTLNIINNFCNSTIKTTSCAGVLNIGSSKLGKTAVLDETIKIFLEKDLGIVIKETNPLLLTTIIQYINNIEPNTTILLHFDDLNSYFTQYSYKEFASLLSSKNVVFLANANDVTTLPIELFTNIQPFNSIIEYTELTVEDIDLLIKTYLPSVSNSKIDFIVEKTSTLNLNIEELLLVAENVLVQEKDITPILERIKLSVVKNNTNKSKKVIKKLYLDPEGNLSAITEEIVDDIIEINENS